MSNSYLLVSLTNGTRIIKFNRPNKKNAILQEMYTQLTQILLQDADNNDVVVTIITGEGEYYSSGNDFSPELTEDLDYDDVVTNRVENAKKFVQVLIDYPKLLIAIVNGPAVGFAVTTLAHFDIVYASEHATFTTPFINLGLCAEGCSSYLFPRIMGWSKASEMLLLGKTMTAEEAFHAGLVAEVVPHDKLSQLTERLLQYGKLSTKMIRNTKMLMSYKLKDTLHKTNELECKILTDCLKSDEFAQGLLNFYTRPKSKL